MTSDRRLYARITVDMPRHPKLLALQPAHRWLYLEAICHCCEYLTDGKISVKNAAVLGADLGGKAARRRGWNALENAGLLERLEDGSGYQIRDYLEHQQSRDQVEELRAKRRQAGSKGGTAKASAVASARADAKQELQQTPSYVDVDVDKELTTARVARASEDDFAKGFEEFWNAYPKQSAPDAAKYAYAKAIQRGSHAAVMEGLRRYRFPAEKRYIPMPSKWLNEGRWKDAPEPPPSAKPWEELNAEPNWEITA